MITANIITLNEEENIADCIASVRKVCDEIIVVDSGSSDNTVIIAESEGAKIIHQPYLGDGFQKNIAAKHASFSWLLSIDADERLTDEMVSAIRDLPLKNTEKDAFSFRRRNMIGSRWIKHCGWYPDYCIRLYNKSKCEFKRKCQHSSVSANDVEKIDVDIIHYSFKDIGELFGKPERNYSKRAAKIMYRDGKKVSRLSPFLHGVSAFINKFFIKKGFLSGVDGMTVSISISVNSYLKYAKLLEFYRDDKVREEEDFDEIW